MKKSSLVFLCLFFTLMLSAQNYNVKGKLLDENNQPLVSATVFTQTIADSTMIDYTVSNMNGDFELPFRTREKKARLVITFNGYETYRKELDLTKQSFDLGSINMQPAAFELEGVSVTAEAAPITVKADTLEFNAGSFKVAPDSNVEALLKQLPGVDVTPDGTITVNGKEVNNILVNGKPFFGKDGKIATQNLPADLIEKIQVTDTKTKEEELSGDDASGEEKTINLTIQEDKNKGLFGKAMLGMGSDDRYESSLLFNTFKGDRKLSVLGSSNNINSIGFSMDEIFDNMGGGRNQSIWTSDDGSFSINGQRFGGSSGITQSHMLGLNYADNWWDETVEPSATYYYTETQTDNDNVTSRVNFLPDGNTVTNSASTTDNSSQGHNLSTDIEIKIDSTFSVYLNPGFKYNTSKNRYSSDQNTASETGEILNESFSNNFTDSESNSFSNELFLYKKFAKKGRGLSFRFESEIGKDESDLLSQSETYFYETGDPDDIRNQNRFDNEDQKSYQFGLGYREPLTDSLRLSLGIDYEISKTVNERNTFDFDDVSGMFDDLNATQSNYYDSRTNELSPEVGLRLRKKKYGFGIEAGANITEFKNYALYLGERTNFNKSYVFPRFRANMNMNFGKSKSMWMSYRFNMNLPSARQILPVANLSNPLNTVIGNADLKPTERHNLYANFNNYDYSTRSGYFIYAGGSYFNNQVVSSTVYDESNRATTTYQNLDDVYWTYFGASFNKSYKQEVGTWRFRVSMDVNLDQSKGLTNAAEYKSVSLQLGPRASVAYEITDLLLIEPSYQYNYYNTNYENYRIDKSSNFTHKAKLETTLRWPLNFVWGNDFGYNYNSNIADGFQKDFYLWNTSLGYNFFGDKLLAKVKVYDLLNQNISSTRSITPTAIVDEQNTVLQRYVMFSLTYKLEMFGGKRKSENHFWRN